MAVAKFGLRDCLEGLIVLFSRLGIDTFGKLQGGR